MWSFTDIVQTCQEPAAWLARRLPLWLIMQHPVRKAPAKDLTSSKDRVGQRLSSQRFSNATNCPNHRERNTMKGIKIWLYITLKDKNKKTV